jgi:hypothetical protein
MLGGKNPKAMELLSRYSDDERGGRAFLCSAVRVLYQD